MKEISIYAEGNEFNGAISKIYFPLTQKEMESHVKRNIGNGVKEWGVFVRKCGDIYNGKLTRLGDKLTVENAKIINAVLNGGDIDAFLEKYLDGELHRLGSVD